VSHSDDYDQDYDFENPHYDGDPHEAACMACRCIEEALIYIPYTPEEHALLKQAVLILETSCDD